MEENILKVKFNNVKKKNYFRDIFTLNEKNKIKTFNDKLYNKQIHKKIQSNKFLQMRNTFMTNFNENINKEQILFEDLNLNFDLNNLENCVNNYKILKSLNPSSTLQKIHNLISNKKDEVIGMFLQNIDTTKKTKELAEKYLHDIKVNNWIISNRNFNLLVDYLNN